RCALRSVPASQYPCRFSSESPSGLARLSYRAPFNSTLKQFTATDPIHEDARRVHHVRIEFSGFHQVLNFCNRNFRLSRHKWIEVARGLAINKVAPLVALPCFHKGEVRLERMLHHIQSAIKLARFLVLANHRANARGRVESGDSRASGPNA